MTGDEVGTHLFHDRANGPFCDAVERVDVWWTGGALDEFGVEELRELARKELTRVVRVKRSHHLDRFGFASTAEGVECGDEAANVGDGLSFVLHRVGHLEARVVVDDYEEVLEATAVGCPKGADDVRVHESPDVRRLVRV